MPPAQVQHADEAAQQSNVSDKNYREAPVHLIVLPFLVCLPTHLTVLKWTLDNGAENSCENSSSDGAQLDASRTWYRCHHRLIAFKLGIEALSDGKLTRSIDYRPEERWQSATIKSSNSMQSVYISCSLE